MFFNNKKVKITENRNAKDKNSPKFIIEYSSIIDEKEKCKKSYEILSELKQENDVILEVSTSMVNIQGAKKESTVAGFLQAVKAASLSFRYRRISLKNDMPLLSNLFNSKSQNQDGYEILVYLSHEEWQTSGFKDILFPYGIRYYICREKQEEMKLLDDIFNGQLLEDEKRTIFDPVVFDCPIFGQMGVFTDTLYLEDLKQRISL